VLAPATAYLQIVAPFYGLLGLGFVISFAGQGAGLVLWPSLGVTARLVVAAGLGWGAVAAFGADMTMLSIVVAASLVAYAAISMLVMVFENAWNSGSSTGRRIGTPA
jgi:hypothetical protein